MSKPRPKHRAADPAYAQDHKIYRLRITLAGTHPPIWRLMEVYGGMELDSLASAVAVAFDWDGEHMAEMEIKGKKYSDESDWLEEQPLWKQAHRVEQLIQARNKPPKERAQALVQFFQADSEPASESGTEDPAQEERVPVLWEVVQRARTKFQYTYDFGDDWKHVIEVEKIEPPDPERVCPWCIDGARAHPIEDCGGPWSLNELIEAAGKPEHPRYGEVVEMMGEKWNPEPFPLTEINRQLAKVFRLRKRRPA